MIKLDNLILLIDKLQLDKRLPPKFKIQMLFNWKNQTLRIVGNNILDKEKNEFFFSVLELIDRTIKELKQDETNTNNSYR